MTSPAHRLGAFAFDPDARVNALIQAALADYTPTAPSTPTTPTAPTSPTYVTFDPTTRYTAGSAGLWFPRSYNERVSDRPFLAEFGAPCDGSAARLNARYTTLAAAQAAFPNAGITASNYTTRSIDTAALINLNAEAGKTNSPLAGRRIAVRGRCMVNENLTLGNIALDLSEGFLDPGGATIALLRRPICPDAACFGVSGTILLPDVMHASPLWWGAKADVEYLTGTIAAGSLGGLTLSRALTVFDVGKVATVRTAGVLYAAKRVAHAARVTAVAGGNGTLAAPASVAVTNVLVLLATDNADALQAAYAASDVTDLGKGFYGQGRFTRLPRSSHRVYGQSRETTGVVRLGTFSGGGCGPLLGDRGWNPNVAANYQGVCRLEHFAMIGMADFFMIQTLDGDPAGSGDGERSFSFGNFREVHVSDCEIGWSRRMGGVCERAERVEYHRNLVHHCLRDGLSAVNCLIKIVKGNRLIHVADDGISLHTSAAVSTPSTWRGIVEMSIVTENHLEDSHGIKHCGGRRATIAFNIFDRCKEYAVNVNYDNNQGRHSLHDIKVIGNDIYNLLSGFVIGGGDRKIGIEIQPLGPVSGAGSQTTDVPGWSYQARPEPHIYKQIARNGQAGNGNPILYSRDFLIALNTINWTNDWDTLFTERAPGQQVWTTSGWYTPNTNGAQVRDALAIGVRISGGIKGAVLANNGFYNGGTALEADTVSGWGMLKGILFEGNSVERMAVCGISVVKAHSEITSRNNVFDIDPLGEAAGASAAGVYASSGAVCAFLVPVKGVDSLGDTFKHMVRPASAPGNIIIRQPTYHRNPANGAGVLEPITGVGERTINNTPDYASAAYGQIAGYA